MFVGDIKIEAEKSPRYELKIILEEIHEVFKNNAELIAIVGFLAGTLVENYFSIERDRRKEFNEIVDPIYFKMKSQIEARFHYAEDFDATVIRHHLAWYQRRTFRNCAERYNQSKNGVSKYQPSTGEVTIDEAAKSKMLKWHLMFCIILTPLNSVLILRSSRMLRRHLTSFVSLIRIK